jgi:hypothetical protein
MVSSVTLLQSIFLRRTLAIAGACLLGSCITLPKKEETAQAPLKLTPPTKRGDQTIERERWVTIRLPEGQIFAQAKEGMDDVISLSAAESPKIESVKTLNDVELILRGDGNTKFERLRNSEVLGQAAIRYERRVETTAPESDVIRASLNATSRSMPGPFTSRTLGAVFMHPTKPSRYVTLTCTRTSYHGEIGTYYEELFDDFIQTFVMENFITAY